MVIAAAIGAERLSVARFLRQVGIYAMAVYVMHVIVGAGVRAAINGLGGAEPWIYFTAISLAGLVLPIAFQKVSDRLRLTPVFGIRPVWPERSAPVWQVRPADAAD